MSQRRTRTTDGRSTDASANREHHVDGRAIDATADLLDLLGDDYARSAIEAIRDEPLSGAEVAETTGMSKPTAFRRLNDLVEFGLVEVRRRIDTDGGHHSKLYALVVDSLAVDFENGDVRVSLRTDPTASERSFPSRRDRDSPPTRAAVSD